MKPKPTAEKAEVQAPSLVKDTHVLGRRVGFKEGWENLSVFERAHRSGKLVDKDRCKDDHSTKVEAEKALDRYEAGDRFTEGWKIASAGNWASGSDFNRVRAVGCPGSFVDIQIDVKNFMRALEQCLGVNDWMILRRVCGENYPIAEAVTEISPGYRYSTLARFRESLDALVGAVPAAMKKAREK